MYGEYILSGQLLFPKRKQADLRQEAIQNSESFAKSNHGLRSFPFFMLLLLLSLFNLIFGVFS